MKSFLVLLFVMLCGYCQAQDDGINKVFNRVKTIGSNSGGTDTSKSKKTMLGFEHRNDLKDSITTTYRYLDSVHNNRPDSSINDFDKYFSVPSTFQYLGNNGAAAYSLIYSPDTKPGWDAGFHAFDIYRFTLENTKFYKTTKPYTLLGYELASGKEQMIQAFHTQNPRPNWNFGFNYRLISSPGFFVTQSTNHKNFQLFSNYQGKRKRYALFMTMISNNIKASENGGIVNDSSLSDPNKKKRFSVPVNLGGANAYEPNPLISSITTGNQYRDFTFFLRQTYDIGKKDSIAINDTTTEYLFYPKLRAQHTFTYSTYSYQFKDAAGDSTLYNNWYGITFSQPIQAFNIEEKWTVLKNDFSLLQFPETKNPAQFLLAGATLENIKGELKGGTEQLYNVMLHSEYRNKTRNKLWDVLLKGELYLTGFNSGDYTAQANIGRYLNKKLGDVKIFFTNTSRTPSFIYNGLSTFNLTNTTLSKKENVISFGAEANNPFINLAFRNHIITNLSYFTDYYHIAQSSKVINLLQVFGSRKTRINRKVSLYTEAVLQQVDGSAPVKVPLLFTRNRLAFEGNFYKNLYLSTGLEVRYYTPYKAYNYSPVMGQFSPQDTATLKNLPDISAFFDFRIKGLTFFIRGENLNTISFSNGFGFTDNNFAAPHYPTEGLVIRFGIRWSFVN